MPRRPHTEVLTHSWRIVHVPSGVVVASYASEAAARIVILEAHHDFFGLYELVHYSAFV